MLLSNAIFTCISTPLLTETEKWWRTWETDEDDKHEQVILIRIIIGNNLRLRIKMESNEKSSTSISTVKLCLGWWAEWDILNKFGHPKNVNVQDGTCWWEKAGGYTLYSDKFRRRLRKGKGWRIFNVETKKGKNLSTLDLRKLTVPVLHTETWHVERCTTALPNVDHKRWLRRWVC